MPEIEITIDTDKGTLESEIRGVRGPACEKAARALREISGSPTTDRKTREYYAEVASRPRVKGGGK